MLAKILSCLLLLHTMAASRKQKLLIDLMRNKKRNDLTVVELTSVLIRMGGAWLLSKGEEDDIVIWENSQFSAQIKRIQLCSRLCQPQRM